VEHYENLQLLTLQYFAIVQTHTINIISTIKKLNVNSQFRLSGKATVCIPTFSTTEKHL